MRSTKKIVFSLYLFSLIRTFVAENNYVIPIIMEKTIDLHKIIYSKLGNKARLVPIKWFEKFIHLDEINEFLWESRDLKGTDWTEAALKRLNITLKVEGRENLPPADTKQAYTFVSNHSLGAADGIGLLYTLGTHFGGAERVGVFANDILTHLPGIKPFIIPINKTGAQDRSLPAVMNGYFSSDKHILLFPAGIVGRKKNGVVHDLEWSKIFITQSVKNKRDVVPIHFIGENSPFFYRITRYFDWFLLRKGAGRFFNFFLLPDEMMKTQGKTYRVVIGKPIPWQTFDKSRKPKEWAQYVSDIVHKL